MRRTRELPAYYLASIVIFAVPWCTSTVIGLSARVIENNAVWVLYLNALSEQQEATNDQDFDV
jgi:low affinity Fe/Cu permease